MFNPNAFYNDEQWQDIVKRVTDLSTDVLFTVMSRNIEKSNRMETYLAELEELVKMTKIDETKQYKFSEIIAMVESKALPEGTKVAPNGVFDYLLVGEGSNVNKLYTASGGDVTMFNLSMAFSELWTIKLPKEEQFYLKAPECFGVKYLNLQFSSGEYFFASSSNTNGFQTKFTQSEISALPFKTSFFEKIKVEDEK
ncbi:hypothetical protein MX630_04945 [Carnobacterium divergens]|uniref:hypothetical protein n=1 Tax=Carnobacterium divergens TaxID=2748 RepID=UPI00288CF455|nr:hypothetical protein [Carnobacterium divergens]MDT1950089.1 hypothetical protein [Carnobacterium divergens]MDT1955267.1 hypothetical protein [Carnobacterium divergens]MDT1960505.1 hypothetical protein [Carnobacterium divergens]MDT1963049.1 hypothetical protein [Carnobacterium divergens]